LRARLERSGRLVLGAAAERREASECDVKGASLMVPAACKTAAAECNSLLPTLTAPAQSAADAVSQKARVRRDEEAGAWERKVGGRACGLRPRARTRAPGFPSATQAAARPPNPPVPPVMKAEERD
jgi:hypothetical protein